MSHFLSYEGGGWKKTKHVQTCNFFVFTKKEEPFTLECWLGEEQQEKSNCIGSAVFGGIIEGCATGSGAVIGSAIVVGAILGYTMVGCIMVSIAIADGAIEDITIRGRARLHHLLVHHCRQRHCRQYNQWVCNQ